MAFADANRAQIRVLEETVWGTTPASGLTREVRLTSSSLAANKETVVSDEIRADRMVSAITEVAASSSGDINFEWSSGPQDEFLAGFLLNTWARPMTMDFWKGVSVTGASAITVFGTDITDYLINGRIIKLYGFVDPANNGYFEIASTALSGSDTVVTIVETSLVVEGSSTTTRLYDANDVIIHNDTNISSSATGFSSGATNAFTSPIAAGQLVIGQKIYVDNLGYETGTVTLTDPTALTTLTLTVFDGINTGVLVGGTDFVIGVDADTDGAALTAAINGLRLRAVNPVNVKATHVPATDIITITNLNTAGGGAITETVDDATVTVADFSGGVAGATGIFTITSLGDDDIGVTPAPPVVSAGAVVNIKSSHLRNTGDETAIAQRSWSIETAFTDVSQYMEQDGMVPGTFSLDISSGAIVTGTIGFEGRATSMAQAVVLGTAPYTVLDAQPGEVVNATTDIGDLSKDSVAFSACIQSLSLSGEAGLRMQNCVGFKFPRGIGTGRFNLSGSMTVYFETEELFNNFIDHDTISLAWAITDAEGSAYYFTVPAVKLSADAIAPGGIDQDVFETLEWTAFRDATTDTMFQIDRFSPNNGV